MPVRSDRKKTGRALICASCEAGVPYDYARAVIAVSNYASASAFRYAGFTTDRIPRTLVTCKPTPGGGTPPDGVMCHHVHTLTYEGIWVEPLPGAHYDARLLAGMAYGRGLAATGGAHVVGAFASPEKAAALQEAFGANRVGEYHWWVMNPPAGG